VWALRAGDGRQKRTRGLAATQRHSLRHVLHHSLVQRSTQCRSAVVEERDEGERALGAALYRIAERAGLSNWIRAASRVDLLLPALHGYDVRARPSSSSSSKIRQLSPAMPITRLSDSRVKKVDLAPSGSQLRNAPEQRRDVDQIFVQAAVVQTSVRSSLAVQGFAVHPVEDYVESRLALGVERHVYLSAPRRALLWRAVAEAGAPGTRGAIAALAINDRCLVSEIREPATHRVDPVVQDLRGGRPPSEESKKRPHACGTRCS
jgi:hypothetical protein